MKTMGILFLLCVLLLLPAVLLMGYRVFFTRKGKFPSTHVDTNPALRKKGIRCVQAQDAEARRKNPLSVEAVANAK